MIPAAVRAAASMLLLRERAGRIEVLLQRRAQGMAFGDMWVFPGGVHSPADGELGADPDAALRRTAARETFEEARIRIAEPEVGGAIAWCRWITPPSLTKRFDTRFYAVRAPSGQRVVGDAIEAVESAWLAPADALAEMATRRMRMMPPTAFSLMDLLRCERRHGSIERLLLQERARRIVPIMPRSVGEGEGRYSVYPWNPLYAALSGEGYPLEGEVPEYLRELPPRWPLPA